MNAITKKYFALLFLAACFVQMQAQVFAKNELGLMAGVGLSNQIILKEHALKMPPLTVSVEKGIVDNIIAGVTFGYASSQSTRYELLDDSYRIRYRYLWAAARVAYYFNLASNEKIRASTGLSIGWGYGFADFVGTGDLESVSMNYAPVIGQVIGVFGNVQYRLHPYLWVFGELGLGGTPLQAGVFVPLQSSHSKPRFKY